MSAIATEGIKAWIAGRRAPSAADAVAQKGAGGREVARDAAPRPDPARADPARADPARIEAVAKQASERLWRLAFAVPALVPVLGKVHRDVRAYSVAALQSDALDPRYFPRRPTLLPQLLQAAGDAGTAAETLSRMIAHDPVLAADVLRLANSSLYRTSTAPIETIQRAIVVCGIDALRGLIATAMLQPVFRATRTNFPRFPRLLWERTERAGRAAEIAAARLCPDERFEAQLLTLLSALGPLAVYGVSLDGYARAPRTVPSAHLCAGLVGALGQHMSRRIARHWGVSSRLIAALDRAGDEPLVVALAAGELLATLSVLKTHALISVEEGAALAADAGIAAALAGEIGERLAGGA